MKACNVAFWLEIKWGYSDVMCLCYSHHQTSDLSIKSKMMVWKSICQEIFCFDLHGQTLIFCCESLTIHKVPCEISFHNLVSRLLLLLLWWTRGLVIRNRQTCGIRLQVATASNQTTKVVRFTVQTCNFAPLTRWCHELRKGALPWVLVFDVGISTRGVRHSIL